MKNNSLSYLGLLFGAGLLSTFPALSQSIYQIGDAVEDFTVVNRQTGQPARLSDFSGKIVFIDWFAHWCPFCQAAAPVLEKDIKNYYRDKGGNPDGVEVVYVAFNLQADSGSNKASTDAFVNKYGFDTVLQDTSRTLQRRFFSASGQPTFAVINGVANSPSHKQWELVYSRNNYGANTQPIQAFRTAIDSIKKAAVIVDPPTPVFLRNIQHTPSGTPDGMLSFNIEGNVRDKIVLETSADMVSWSDSGVPVPADPTVPVQIPISNGQTFFRGTRKP